MTGRARLVARPLQVALYTALTGSPAVTALLDGRIYDHVPEPAVHPYLVIGEAVEEPDNTHTSFGRQADITLHLWDQVDGFSRPTAIVAALVELLDHQRDALSIVGHRVVSIRFVDVRTLRDSDPRIRHVPVRIRVNTQQEA
ncbi:DUF3168 domain-containing protein [Micromonospora yangpuensis]|uniref:DUF3168 domain-containing protein n=1 Tax=Micromonospora yangpuensis TaxID=683228 RepID=A0A1C6VEL7_9ACTN|nr:DUF3168 domain-containing protein [Micromonospora yangpuensis]GGM14288.1 hypothetical protein GCM10012279_35520 [Micromonospora yangpuensis]SCL64587.1 Protein of unknown function [Micromonospora yangpuensis]